MSENNKQDEIIEKAKEEVSNLKESVENAVDDAAENAKEPIASIEQTVEDLKKKIQGITEEKGEEKPIELKLSDEQKQKIEDIKDNTVKSVNETIENVRKTADNFSKSVDVQKTVNYLKANVVGAIDTAKSKIEEIRENPELKKTLDEAGTKVREFGEKAGDTVEGLFSEEQKTGIRKNVEKAGDVVSSTVDSASKAITDFVNKPEVQEKIEKTKAGAMDLASKGSAAIKELFDKKEGE